ncbi:DNA primase/polymerase [Streptomyces phage LazerLemon]|nr:DNA primase/polymerase [Streptomyces phage LazerLemon]
MKYLKGNGPAAPEPAADELLTAALALADEGVRVFPTHRVVDGECTCMDAECKSPGKHPRTKNGSKEATTDPATIKTWWSKWGKHGRLNFGQTLEGRAVVDIDVAEGKPGNATFEALMAEHAPVDWTPNTLEYLTGRGGTQYVYRLPEGQAGGKADGYSNTLGEAVDFKTGPNSYVMVPGSKTDGVYTVVVEAHPAELPEWIAALAKSKATKKAEIGGKTVTITGGSLLSELITLPPDDPRRGNNWLAQLAGHYAKTYRDKKDLYLAHCRVMNAMSVDPIGEADFEKTTESIWGAEQAKKLDASEHTGWLISGGDHLLVEMRPKPDPGGSPQPEPPESFADFDIKAVGLVAEPGKRGRSYDVIITRQRDGEQFSEVVDAEILVDFRKLSTWLAEVAGVSIALPSRAQGDMSATTRLLRYLEQQKPPVSVLVGQIGFQPGYGQFLTPYGVIKPGATGLVPFEGVRPRPKLPGFDRYDPPFNYGFAPGGVNELREVVSEVLTFHDRTALTVTASWSLMTLVKSEIRAKGKISVFPFMAIEAVSGSGKTTGAIKMLGELCGYSLGDVQPTPADLRDKLAAFRSGYVHFDDPNDLKRYGDLLRVAATEGTISKRQDAEHSMSAHMTGGLLITGEGLGISNQKALLDRTVSVPLPSTKGQKDYSHVKALWQRYDGSLTALAGTLVAAVLEHVDEIPGLVAALRPGGGRRADGYGVVRAGARVLDWILDPARDWEKAKAGKGASAALVDAWAKAAMEGQPDEAEDFLTLTVLPWAVRQFGGEPDVLELVYKGYRPKVWPAKIRNEHQDDTKGKEPYPAGPAIYFNASELCEVWALKEGKGDETRLINSNSVSRQAGALGLMKRSIKLGGAGQARYWVITGDLAQTILDRSEE